MLLEKYRSKSYNEIVDELMAKEPGSRNQILNHAVEKKIRELLIPCNRVSFQIENINNALEWINANDIYLKSGIVGILFIDKKNAPCDYADFDIISGKNEEKGYSIFDRIKRIPASACFFIAREDLKENKENDVISRLLGELSLLHIKVLDRIIIEEDSYKSLEKDLSFKKENIKSDDISYEDRYNLYKRKERFDSLIQISDFPLLLRLYAKRSIMAKSIFENEFEIKNMLRLYCQDLPYGTNIVLTYDHKFKISGITEYPGSIGMTPFELRWFNDIVTDSTNRGIVIAHNRIAGELEVTKAEQEIITELLNLYQASGIEIFDFIIVSYMGIVSIRDYAEFFPAKPDKPAVYDPKETSPKERALQSKPLDLDLFIQERQESHTAF